MIITQSLIKQLYHKGDEIIHCPFKIKTLFIDRIESPPTQPQLEGNYFETLCLGSGSHDRIVTDLPRIKPTKKQKENNEPGRKHITQIRIEYQAEVFLNECNNLKININKSNTQTSLSKKINCDFELQGCLDIFPVYLDGKINIIDLKLTKDINNEYGIFCWGQPERMDDIQGLIYRYLAHEYIKENVDYIDWNIDLDNIDDWLDNNIIFKYWVFDSKPIPENKFIKSRWDQNTKNNLKETIRKTMELLSLLDKHNWPKQPDYNVCKWCPLNPKYLGGCSECETTQST
jgi:hypothetical protein